MRRVFQEFLPPHKAHRPWHLWARETNSSEKEVVRALEVAMEEFKRDRWGVTMFDWLSKIRSGDEVRAVLVRPVKFWTRKLEPRTSVQGVDQKPVREKILMAKTQRYPRGFQGHLPFFQKLK